jgi:hypothetical protein
VRSHLDTPGIADYTLARISATAPIEPDDGLPGRRSNHRFQSDTPTNHPLRCRILARIRRFLRPIFLRPFPVFFVPMFQQSPDDSLISAKNRGA